MGSNLELGALSALCFCACPSCFCMGFLQVLWFPPQKHASKWTGKLGKWIAPRCVYVLPCDGLSFQSGCIFSPCSQCSWNKLHLDPDQETGYWKQETEIRWMNESFYVRERSARIYSGFKSLHNHIKTALTQKHKRCSNKELVSVHKWAHLYKQAIVKNFSSFVFP